MDATKNMRTCLFNLAWYTNSIDRFSKQGLWISV